MLQPALASLADWRSDHPTVSGTLWTNPLLLADLDPTESDGAFEWMGALEWQGEIRWKAGDLLLVCPFDRDTPKLEYPVIDRLAGSSASTWGPWIAAAEKEGVIRLQSDYEALKVYEIQAQPSPTVPGASSAPPQR